MELYRDSGTRPEWTWDPPAHPWEIRREAMRTCWASRGPFAMTAALQIDRENAWLLVEALIGRSSYEKERRDGRNVWDHVMNAYRKPNQPVFIEPMQVVPVAELPDGGAWGYEAKLDGYRCLAAKRGSGVVLWSRNGNGFTSASAWP
jgi:ATP-dependent DNA ligase